MVHMDELSLIVKKIDDDGSIKVSPLGAILPASFGQGPVDILCSYDILAAPVKLPIWLEKVHKTRTLQIPVG